MNFSPRRVAQDRAAGASRAPGAPAGRAISVMRELTAHVAIHEAVAISTCNRTEPHSWRRTHLEAENASLAILSRQADIRPTELVGSMYSLRGGEAVRHLFSVAAGLDSMIGEAEVQAGQALVRAVPRRGHHRADLEPALPRRARHRQVRAHRDRRGPLARLGALGRGRAGGRGRGRTDQEARRDRRRRERRADRQGASAGRGDGVRGPGATTARSAWRRGSAGARCASRTCRRTARADIVVSCTSSPHQIFGREELEVVQEERAATRWC